MKKQKCQEKQKYDVNDEIEGNKIFSKIEHPPHLFFVVLTFCQRRTIKLLTLLRLSGFFQKHLDFFVSLFFEFTQVSSFMLLLKKTRKKKRRKAKVKYYCRIKTNEVLFNTLWMVGMV